MRPFRFGVQAIAARSANAWRDLTRRAEDLGYSTLSLAAREADIASVPWAAVDAAGLTPHRELTRRIGFVRDAAGARLGELDLEISPYYANITERADDAMQRLAAAMSDTDPDAVRDHPNFLVRFVEDVIERLVAQRELFGFNDITIQQELIDAFAPVRR